MDGYDGEFWTLQMGFNMFFMDHFVSIVNAVDSFLFDSNLDPDQPWT